MHAERSMRLFDDRSIRIVTPKTNLLKKVTQKRTKVTFAFPMSSKPRVRKADSAPIGESPSKRAKHDHKDKVGEPCDAVSHSPDPDDLFEGAPEGDSKLKSPPKKAVVTPDVEEEYAIAERKEREASIASVQAKLRERMMEVERKKKKEAIKKAVDNLSDADKKRMRSKYFDVAGHEFFELSFKTPAELAGLSGCEDFAKWSPDMYLELQNRDYRQLNSPKKKS
jgi:hypothetical protein